MSGDKVTQASDAVDDASFAPILSLTFDDGPDPIWTSRMLGQLEASGIAATFFMVGERVLTEPGLARRVLAAGHELQLHCHRHLRHTELTEAELQRDTVAALETLAGVGANPRLWRAPWGVCTAATRRVAQRLDLTLVGWSIDTHDWRGDAPEAMFNQASARLAGGGSVLMHDALGPGARRTGCENTLALVGKLVAAARARGLRVAPMGQVLPAGVAA